MRFMAEIHFANAELYAYTPQLQDFDAIFAKTNNPMIIGTNVDLHNPDSLKELLYDASAKQLEFVPSCNCGYLRSTIYKGMTCPRCDHVVETSFTTDLSYKAWIDIPEFFPPILHPAVAVVLEAWFGTPLFNALLGEQQISATTKKKLQHFGGSGYSYVYNNLWQIIDTAVSVKSILPKMRRDMIDDIKIMLKMYEPILFVRHLPILNKSLHMVSRRGDITYTDKTIKPVMGAAIQMACMCYEHFGLISNPKSIDKNIYALHRSYTEYHSSIFENRLSGKPKFIRQQVLGSKWHCTCRGVIAPLVGEHDPEIITIPWRTMVIQLHCEILNVLMNRYHMTKPDAWLLWSKAIVAYDQTIHDVINTLIAECPFKGLPILFGRNPSIRYGCLELLYGVLDPNVNNKTFGMSSMICCPFNADYDGDCMYAIFLKEMAEVHKYWRFEPKSNLVAGNGREITSDINVTDQHILALNAFIHQPIDERIIKYAGITIDNG